MTLDEIFDLEDEFPPFIGSHGNIVYIENKPNTKIMNPKIAKLNLLSSMQEYQDERNRAIKAKYMTLFEKIVSLKKNKIQVQELINELNVLDFMHFRDGCENEKGYSTIKENDEMIVISFTRIDGSASIKEIRKDKEYYKKLFNNYLKLIFH